MKILGIHDGHTATACLLVDGEIIAMASEERFNRTKRSGGFPAKTIQWILSSTKTEAKEIDIIALSSFVQPVENIEDSSFRRQLYFNMIRYFPKSIMGSKELVKPYVKIFSKLRKIEELKDFMLENDIAKKRLNIVGHHRAHAAASYYFSGYREYSKKTLVIILDGSGDGLSGSAWVGKGNHLDKLLDITSFHSIGELYSRTTQFLGMRPLDEEHKVMGLAGYIKEQKGDFQKGYKIFKKYIGLSKDGLRIINYVSSGPDLLKKMEQDLKGMRFDQVAYGIQRRTEEVITAFVRNWVRETEIKTVAVGGGCFMNIKVNKLVANIPEISQIFFLPSCGDESTAMGAAVDTYIEKSKTDGKSAEIRGLSGLYFGPGFSAEAIQGALERFHNQIRFSHHGDIEKKAADILSENYVVARFTGRMEWGARALGNRSILCNAKDLSNIRRLNLAIKKRDFWMPFAPSIITERQNMYINNSKKLSSPYMMLAFDATAKAKQDIPAALHLFDLTCRPQIVKESINPKYYRLLRLYEERTGMAGIINTSFNLHGEPMVCSPDDALETFLRSNLDFLIMDNFLVERK